ncbi:MAG: hypothetical protein K6G33_14895 [Ruminococcus sp.]|uniref:hypothetical protein n=1 Tax=Ruminococcus sp. TaxID=41978 RepID=UPI0025E7E741|nr:hypothetical protein [Ruminococcus sp.]MCR5602012.1 hypothetical protein [Ruminococcus sp.]
MKSNKKRITTIALSAAMMFSAVAAPAALNSAGLIKTNSFVNELSANAAYATNVVYTVNVSSGVNVRSSRSTANSSNIRGTAPYGADCIITSVVGSWGYTSRIRCGNGFKSGWIYLPNLKQGWPCKITASSLRLRKNPGSTASSNTTLTYIPRNTIVVITGSKKYANSVWLKTSYAGHTGWICFYDQNGQYAIGVSDNGTEF